MWPELEEEAGQGYLFKREGFPRARKWSSALGLCVGQPAAHPWLVLELPVVMDMLYLYTVQYGRHQPHLAAEHLNVAGAAEERSFLSYPLLVNYNLNIQLWAVAITLNSAVLEFVEK